LTQEVGDLFIAIRSKSGENKEEMEKQLQQVIEEEQKLQNRGDIEWSNIVTLAFKF
jgi:LDH2 family malate/lactate/ureidoglycolate dehydrogenase